MNGARILEPEWLDTLPPHDPRARRSRRDLVRINALMGNTPIVRAALLAAGKLERVAEIGAGAGTLLFGALAKSRPPAGARVVLVDRQPVVTAQTLDAFARHGWHAQVAGADVFDWLETGSDTYDAIVANLFVHHFDEPQIRRMLALVARRARCFIACEPRRAAFALTAARLLGLAGCNDVSRHDAVASVRAGFAGKEVSALWPSREGWTLEEGARGLFSHAFIARRSS